MAGASPWRPQQAAEGQGIYDPDIPLYLIIQQYSTIFVALI